MMPEGSGFAKLRDALNKAKVGTESDLEFAKTPVVVAALSIKQLHVTYKSGNEFLQLGVLYEALQECGEVNAFEFRGRGGQPGECPTLVADLDISGEKYQLIYHLPGN